MEAIIDGKDAADCYKRMVHYCPLLLSLLGSKREKIYEGNCSSVMFLVGSEESFDMDILVSLF